MLAPIGSIESFDPGGGATSAKASAEFGVPQMLSSVCNPGLEAVAKAADNFRIFQLYVRGDDAWVDDHVKRARDHGYAAFCLTVDTAVYSRRERDIAKRFVKPWRARASGLRLPGRALLGSRQALQGHAPGHAAGRSRASRHGEDAALAVEHGVEVVYVSQSRRPAARPRARQHGRAARGRRRRSTGRATVIVDGAFMRGTDVVKAIASAPTRSASAASSASASPRRACRAWCARSSCSRTRSASAWACSGVPTLAELESLATCTRRRRWRGPTSPARSRCSRRGTRPPMKVTGIDTYDLRIPTVKPMALEFAEHRVVAARHPHRRGHRRARLHAGLRRRGRRVDPGLSRDPPQAAAPRRGSRCSSSACGSACSAPTAASSARASPPTRSARSTSASGTSSARRRACRSTSSGAPSPTACPPTAAAAGATTRPRT